MKNTKMNYMKHKNSLVHYQDVKQDEVCLMKKAGGIILIII